MPSSTAVEDRLARRKSLAAKRGTLNIEFQDLADLFLPGRADFTVERSPGQKRMDEIYDNTPMQARRDLVAAIVGSLWPQSIKWLFMHASNTEVDQDDTVRRALEISENRMRRAFYDPRARWIQRSGELMNDVVTFGTGLLFTGLTRSLDGLLFRSIHLRDALIAENSEGAIDTALVTQKITARQAMLRWGRENVGPKTEELLNDKKPDEIVEYLWTIEPRLERDPTRADNRNMAFRSTVDEVASATNMLEGGFKRFPIAAVRWDTMSGEIYGRSPAMIAQPDAETLQAMGKTILIAAQRAADPPKWAVSDGVRSEVRSVSGQVTVVDGRVMRELGQVPFGDMTSNANMPLGIEMQNATRELVGAAFFRHVLQLPLNRPEMTATEIHAHTERFGRVMGPVYGTMQAESSAEIAERAFELMLDAGQFPELLAALPDGGSVQFRFEDPVLRARRSMELAGLARSIDMLQTVLAAKPEGMDRIDVDTITSDLDEAGGFSRRWLLSDDRLAALRQRKAQQAAQEEAKQGAMAAVDAAGTVMPMLTQQQGQAA